MRQNAGSLELPCRFEVEALCPVPQSLRKKQPCYALQGPDASTELQMIAALKSLSPDSLPLLPSLLGPPCRSVWPHTVIHPHLAQPASGSALPPSISQGENNIAASRSAVLRLTPSPAWTASTKRDKHPVDDDSMQSSLPTQPQSCSAPLVSPLQAAIDNDSDFIKTDERQKGLLSSGGKISETVVPADSVDADSIIRRFGLNEEQAAALRAMEAWAVPGASQVLHP